jgi:hypothetical protein
MLVQVDRLVSDIQQLVDPVLLQLLLQILVLLLQVEVAGLRQKHQALAAHLVERMMVEAMEVREALMLVVGQMSALVVAEQVVMLATVV